MAGQKVERMSKDMLYAYAVLVGTTLLAASPVPVPVYVHMLAVVLSTIYIGCMGSTHAETAKQAETMESKDAYMFPVVGSGVLLSLYLVFKFLKKEWVNFVIKMYFFVFGVIILGGKVSQILSMLLPVDLVTSLTAKQYTFHIPIIPYLNEAPKKDEKDAKKKDGEEEVDPNKVDLTHLDIVAYIVAGVVGVWYLKENHWAASNIFGIAFSIQGIEMLNLGSFFNGAVLLSGLFFYDIFWVFGTDVMVTVAKSFDAPIKLLFPQMLALTEDGDPTRPSMLGLGDIVIPGVFIALMLRFDLSLPHNKGKQPAEADRTYFFSQLACYFLGLSTTVGIMYFFEAAQPALLYLVPACLGSAFGTAFLKGHLKLLLAHTEEEDKKEEIKKEK